MKNLVSNTKTMTTSEVSSLINEPRTCAKKGSFDFDTPGALSDCDYVRLTGITSSNFESLFEQVDACIRSTATRSKRTCLAILLIKLRTGLSHSILSTLFRIPRRAIGKTMDSARKALMEKFVALHLCLNHISRDDFIKNHTREIAKALFADGKDVAIFVADGTYIYMERSSNYSFQRRTYSVHKGRPLVKPMMLVSRDL